MLKNLTFYIFVALIASGIFLSLMPYPTFYRGTYNLSKSDISKINFSSEVESYNLEIPQEKIPMCVKLNWTCVNALLDFDTPLRIIDVKSEIMFKIYRFAGKSHADIRAFDDKDKLILNSLTENTPKPRPCLIEIKENLWVCSSLSTKVQTDADEKQHFCLYFDGSCSHSTGQEDCMHQKAVDYAQKHGEAILKKIVP